VGCRKGSETENDRQEITRRKLDPDCQTYPELALALNYNPDVADYLMTSTFVLSGLRLDQQVALKLFRRYHAVEDSTTYQYIIEQGALKGVRALLLELGASRFGAPSEKVKASIQELEDLPRLKRMGLRVLTAKSWNDILKTS
jgi:Mg/Co/Ni transporter MgtE